MSAIFNGAFCPAFNTENGSVYVPGYSFSAQEVITIQNQVNEAYNKLHTIPAPDVDFSVLQKFKPTAPENTLQSIIEAKRRTCYQR